MKSTSSSSTKVFRITSISHVNISHEMNGNLKEEETIYQTERKQKSKTPARINQESIYIYFT